MVQSPLSQGDWDDVHLINDARGLASATDSSLTNCPGADHRR
jgi:hypothetical protein